MTETGAAEIEDEEREDVPPRAAPVGERHRMGGRVLPRHVAKVSEVVAREILDHILTDDLPPGTRLPPESEMLKAYDIGRGSLREALRILEVYGILSIRPGPGGGPVVEKVGPRNLARLMSFYLSVEGRTIGDLRASGKLLYGAMVAMAAKRRDPAQVAAMREALARAASTVDEIEYGRAIRDLRSAMFLVPGGEILNTVRDALHETSLLRLRRSVSLDAARELLPDHVAMVDAIERGDADEAERILAEHDARLDALYDRVIPGLDDEPVVWT